MLIFFATLILIGISSSIIGGLLGGIANLIMVSVKHFKIAGPILLGIVVITAGGVRAVSYATEAAERARVLERTRQNQWRAHRNATVAEQCSAYGITQARWNFALVDPRAQRVDLDWLPEREVAQMTVGIGNPFGSGDAVGYPMCRFVFERSGRTLYARSNEYGPNNLMHIPRGTDFSDRVTYEVGQWFEQQYGRPLNGETVNWQETRCFDVFHQSRLFPLPVRQNGTLDEACMDAIYALPPEPPRGWSPASN